MPEPLVTSTPTFTDEPDVDQFAPAASRLNTIQESTLPQRQFLVKTWQKV